MAQTTDAPVRKRTLPRDKYELKNLKFLGDFMTAMGLTTTTAGEKIGLTQVSVYYWLKKDDARLSVVNKLIEACGYKLIIDYVSTEADPFEPEIYIEPKHDKLLTFLAVALQKEDKEKIANELGLGYTTVYYWLTHDDIFISYIFKIAELIGKRVKITIRKAQ